MRMVYMPIIMAVALTVLLIADHRKHQVVAGGCKMLASTAFIVFALQAGALDTLYGKLILTALIFSWWGDFFLIFRQEKVFLCGVASFLFGHIMYGVAFVMAGPKPLVAVIALTALIVPVVIVLRWLNPGLGELRIPVYGYIAVITVMVGLAVGTLHPVVITGAVLFYLSDLYVARDRFKTNTFTNRLIGLPLYYIAQLVLAYSVMLVN